MKKILLVIGVAAILSGCGAEAVPGGTARIHYGFDQNGNPTYDVITNRDSQIQSLKFDPKSGILDLQGYSGNGSNLGLQQMQWSIVESNNRRAVIGDLIGLIQSLAPILGAGGGGGVPSIGGGVPLVDTQAELRAALLAKIAACPLMSDQQKAQLTAAVKAAPANFLPMFAPLVESAITKVTP